MDLEEKLEARITALLPRIHNTDKGREFFESLDSFPEARDEFTPPRLSVRVAKTIRCYVEQLVERRFRTATIKRLADRWSLGLSVVFDGELFGDKPKDEMDEAVGEIVLTGLLLIDDVPLAWPQNVSFIDVANALETAGLYKAKAVAEWLQKFSRVDVRGPFHMPAPNNGVVDPYNALPCAIVIGAAKEAAESGRMRVVPVPSTKKSRAAISVVSQGQNGPWNKEVIIEQEIGKYSIVLVWDGRPRPSQLSLNFPGPVPTTIVRGILDELDEDGLRDYLLLHRMAAEQGRSGVFTWSWAEHRERTAYARRVASSSLNDDQAALEVTRRLWRLKNAEVRHQATKDDGTTAWVRIGPFGLIDIPAGINRKIQDGSSLERARIMLNPDIYEGAHKDAKSPHFALLPNEALLLEGKILRLGTLVSFAMRYARDEGGIVSLPTRDLWEYINTRGGQPQRKRWQAADTTLRRALDKLANAGVIGSWSRDDGPSDPEARYTVRPSTWWQDVVIHGVPTELPERRDELPKVGADLAAWRGKRGWTQAQAAKALDTSVRTIIRTEKAATEPIGGSLLYRVTTYLD